MIGSLFNAQTGDVDLQQKDVNGQGEYFVNSGVQNCGIKGRTDRAAKIFPANTITIDFLGNAYYRPFAYKMATHNHVFSLNGDVLKNELVGLYISAQMSYLSKVYSFNNMGTWPRIKEQEIYLPVTKEGDIDLIYIEERVRELEEERVRELEAYLHEAGFEDCTLSKEEEDALSNIGSTPMIEVTLGELFDICKGRRLTKANMISGNINFIGATAENNGLTNKIGNDSHLHPSNTITVTYNGSVGEAFYQFERFWASDDVNVLYPKYALNENIALYYLAPIRKKGKKYAYSFKWTKEKMEKDSIWIPCKGKEGKDVDFTFMQTYINAIKKQCIAALKREIERERSAYGEVIANKKENSNAYIIDETANNHVDIEYEPQIAAEPFGHCKWEGFDKSIRDFFGNNQTILVGCYKGKKYREWIDAHRLYNIRMGKTKGSMEANRELFRCTSLLVLYEIGKPEKLSAYRIVDHQEISKEELIEMGYPNKKPRKRYMSFSLEHLNMDLTFLVEHHLIERIIELDADHAKGTPIFIEP